ncbi:MAG TPA: glycosyltransferase family 9 protein [Verrucomicrobiae bacterium]|jgi:ADP-heptose:LPS heptosyltransferase
MDARENILLIRLQSIGDIVFTLPAVHAVRENFPRAKLHFLVSKENAQILRGFADVDEIIPLDRAVYRSANLPAMSAGTFQLLRRLRRENFSMAIDFHGLGETALLSWWSGAPERWGSVYHPPRGWTYTRGVPRNQKIHPAEWNLSLLQQCGLRTGNVRNEYFLPDESLDEAKQFFAAHNLDAAKPTLYLQPFTSAAKKNWPFEKYLALAQFWRERGVQVIFSGGLGDKLRLEPARADGFIVAAGIAQLTVAGLMKLSTLIVGGDTGLLHLAVAMGRRVVMLMRSHSRIHTHPFQHADWAVKSLKGQSIFTIEISAVMETIEQVLNLK